MVMDHAPPDGKADDRISVELQPLEIVYNKNTIDQLIGFMMPTIDDSSKAKLLQLAGEKMQQLERATRATLEHQLQEHKVLLFLFHLSFYLKILFLLTFFFSQSLDLIMNLRAPVIILPENKPTPALFMVADLGFLTVKSEPVRPEAKKELKEKQGQVLKEDEFSKLVSMMYDKFLISGRNVQVSIGRSFQECRDAVTVRLPFLFSLRCSC